MIKNPTILSGFCARNPRHHLGQPGELYAFNYLGTTSMNKTNYLNK